MGSWEEGERERINQGWGLEGRPQAGGCLLGQPRLKTQQETGLLVWPFK